jgi:hypothetical protein
VLIAPSTTTAGGNGVFANAGTSTTAIFPTNTFLDANYWADVVFQPTSNTSAISLFTASDTPAELSPNEGQQVEVGVKFQSSVAGQITALKFYRSPSDTDSDLLDLWDSTGNNLASVTFTNTAASGWQTVSLATPVTISANTTYVASYHTSGFFVKTANFFTNAAFMSWSRPELVTNPAHDMFCPGTAYLPNGRLLVNGGSSTPETSIYDPPSSTWSSDRKMNVPRGYNASVLLSNGLVFTLGGSWGGGNVDKIGELWAPDQGWRRLVGISAQPITGPDPEGPYRGDNHAWLFAVRDGRVFHAGPSAEMHWITTEGDGTIVSAGNRADDPYSMNGNAVLYDIGLIFKTGGAPAYTSGPWGNAVATTNT